MSSVGPDSGSPKLDLRLIHEAAKQRHPALRDLVHGLLQEATLPSIAHAVPENVENLDEVCRYRKLRGTNQIQVDRFADQVKALAAPGSKRINFLDDLERYRKRWSDVIPKGEMALTGNRMRDFARALQSHSKAIKLGQAFGGPTALYYDLLNRSPIGSYVSERPAVSDLLERGGTDFVTLCHLPYWRQNMNRHLLEVTKRLCPSGERLDLVMLGDGSGLLGASFGEALKQAGQDFRLIHIDLSPGMLDQQRLRYNSVGVHPEQVISISGNLLRCRLLLKEQVPDLDRTFFVLHEIFDDLRAHSVWSDRIGVGEMHVVFENGAYSGITGFKSEESLIKKLPSYLPFYANNKSEPVMRSFCPEAVILLREMLQSANQSAIYVGDYGWDFINDTPATYPQQLPYRIYGKGIKTPHDLKLVLQHSCSITADTHPALLYMAEAFGGKVEFLGSQEDFIAQVDPTLPESADKMLAECRLICNGEKSARIREHSEALSYCQLLNPSMFAGMVYKNC